MVNMPGFAELRSDLFNFLVSITIFSSKQFFSSGVKYSSFKVNHYHSLGLMNNYIESFIVFIAC